MKRLARSFLIAILIFLFLTPFIRIPAVAQQSENWVDNDYARCLEQATDPNIPDDQKQVCAGAYASMSQGNLITDFLRRILNPIPGVTVTADAYQRNPSYVRQMAQGSAVFAGSKLIAGIFTNPPADLALWIQDTGQTLGFIPKQAYAQGVGFTGLAPLLPIWKAFRNIAYFLLTLVMIAIGFMVMFRRKIDPKTVITVQNALPNIIITLILITFSYAIVGFLIDLMYLLILLAVGIFKSQNLLPDLGAVAKAFAGSPEALYTQGGLFLNIWNIPIHAVKIMGVENWQTLLSAATVATIIGALAGTPFIAIGVLVGVTAGLPLIIWLLIALAMLFLMIRLFILFFSSYLQIILALIFAPLQLLLGSIPGSNAFDSWIKNLIANIAVFPVGAVMFMLAAAFSKFATNATNPGADVTMWAPPFAAPWSYSVASVASLLSIGVLFAIPTIAGSIKEALKAKPFISAGPEGVAGSLAGPGQLAIQGYQMWTSMESAKAMAKLVPVLDKLASKP